MTERLRARTNLSKKKCLILSLFSLFTCYCLTGCTVKVKPESVSDQYLQAKNNLHLLFRDHHPSELNLSFYEALSRGLKYNLDYRIKLANDALQYDQFKLATFAMFPALNLSSSLYTRNNDFATFGITSTGQLTDVLNSTPRTLRSARIAMTWNLLDFGVSYVRAKQQGNRYLIAQEEARKQLQQLTQDILTAYWDAYSAQRLMVTTRLFKRQLSLAKHQLEVAMRDKLVPKENLLSYQQALLEGNRRLVQLQYKYDKATFDLKHLLNLPLDLKVKLTAPPNVLRHAQDLRRLNFEKLDAITLVQRPELHGQNYQKRIAEWGVKQVLLQALPGITLNDGGNYNSNKFMINNKWRDQSIDLAWNLLNLASLPTSLTSAKVQVQYEKLKLLALTMTVLTETRYAYSHYSNLVEEYQVARLQTKNSLASYRLAQNKEEARLGSHQQVLLAEIKTIASRMDEELLLADVSTAFGELYLSAGFDMLPSEAINKPLPVIVSLIRSNFDLQATMDFKMQVDNTFSKLFLRRPQLAKK